ncbi:NADH-quinone oxidoreductase subunit J [Crossiella sp. CA-258035]|uniref:NADH-quinone oxidoreductase subunit J n=1 Tax=Crossiella sp. CA-258035 TaxID=2981138 RepID=UPI0024BC64F7|nr:NADH-quinone oxidoreductase subunit J [Crossiella sp. CA-258035]WHT23750.1 NADH-quinone oxidoreductase subunit J [Crossiella sp. CA-258035]
MLAQAPPNAPEVIKLGEQIMFWVLGPVSLIGAMGMLFARNAVHSALWLVLTMLSLGVLYIVQQAPFLGVVQIIVYTGAIMMLFLFVLMLVGRDSSDSVVEVLRGQRLTATFLGLGLAALLVAALSRAFTDVPSTGLAKVNGSEGPGNVLGLGQLIFREYVFAFELTSALLITAALGAMLLAFVDKEHSTKRSQRELVEARLRGEHDRPSPLPGPGVFATANSVATPALLPDGSVAPESLSKIIESTSRERLADDITEVKGAGPQPDAHALTGPSSKDKKSGAEEGKA